MHDFNPATGTLAARIDRIRHEGCGHVTPMGCPPYRPKSGALAGQLLREGQVQMDRAIPQRMPPARPLCPYGNTQTEQIGLKGVALSGSCPAKPGDPRLRQRPFGRNIVNCKIESMT